MSIGGTCKRVKLSAETLRIIDAGCKSAKVRTVITPEELAITREVVARNGGRILVQRICEKVTGKHISTDHARKLVEAVAAERA